MKRIRIGILGLFLLVPGFVFAQGSDVPEDLFILSSHTASSEWAQQMLAPIAQMRSLRPDLNITLEHLQLLSHKSVGALQHWENRIITATLTIP